MIKRLQAIHAFGRILLPGSLVLIVLICWASTAHADTVLSFTGTSNTLGDINTTSPFVQSANEPVAEFSGLIDQTLVVSGAPLALYNQSYGGLYLYETFTTTATGGVLTLTGPIPALDSLSGNTDLVGNGTVLVTITL